MTISSPNDINAVGGIPPTDPNSMNNKTTTSPSAASPKSQSASNANNNNYSNAISSPTDFSAVAEANNANSGDHELPSPKVLYGDRSREDIRDVLNIIEGRLIQNLPNKEGDETNWMHRIFSTGDNITEGIRALLDQVHSIRNKLDSEQHSNKRSRTTITSSEEASILPQMTHHT